MGGDESIDCNFLLLSDSVCSGGGLDIVLGVPIGVKDDDFGGSYEVDSNSSCLGWYEKYFSLALCKTRYGSVTIWGVDASMQKLAHEAQPFNIMLQQFKRVDKLGEDQCFLALFSEFL